MTKTVLPQAQNWNHYWSLDQSKKFTKVSWSKRRIMDVIFPFTKKGARALDAGCGSGFFSKYFCDQGMTTFALDYSDSALSIAKEITGGRCQLIKKDLLNDRLADCLGEKFDLIFTDGLLEHFSPGDQDKIIRNFCSVLAEDGVIVTFVPNRWSPWELIRPLFMPGIEEKPFVLSELRDLNQRNGLKVIAQGGINTFPFIFSPDSIVGSQFGMLLYTISKKL